MNARRARISSTQNAKAIAGRVAVVTISADSDARDTSKERTIRNPRSIRNKPNKRFW